MCPLSRSACCCSSALFRPAPPGGGDQCTTPPPHQRSHQAHAGVPPCVRHPPHPPASHLLAAAKHGKRRAGKPPGGRAAGGAVCVGMEEECACDVSAGGGDGERRHHRSHHEGRTGREAGPPPSPAAVSPIKKTRQRTNRRQLGVPPPPPSPPLTTPALLLLAISLAHLSGTAAICGDERRVRVAVSMVVCGMSCLSTRKRGRVGAGRHAGRSRLLSLTRVFSFSTDDTHALLPPSPPSSQPWTSSWLLCRSPARSLPPPWGWACSRHSSTCAKKKRLFGRSSSEQHIRLTPSAPSPSTPPDFDPRHCPGGQGPGRRQATDDSLS